MDGHASEKIKISVGVPQGSILGAILFIIFINDILLLDLNGIITLFADDTNLFYFGVSINELILLMAEDLIKLTDWLKLNKLFINIDKTNYVIFHKQRTELNEIPELKLKENIIKRVNTAKFLGLIIDESLLWEEHIKHVARKISPIIGVLHRLKNIIADSAKKSIYFGLIHSHLQYLNVIWGTATESRLRSLKVLQNRSLKTLYGLHRRTPTEELYQNLNILPLHTEIQLSSSIFAYSVINGLKMSQTIFQLHGQVQSNVVTKNTQKIHTKHYKSTKYGINGTYNFICKAYNSLPTSIISKSRFSNFKEAASEFFQLMQ